MAWEDLAAGVMHVVPGGKEILVYDSEYWYSRLSSGETVGTGIPDQMIGQGDTADVDAKIAALGLVEGPPEPETPDPEPGPPQ